MTKKRTRPEGLAALCALAVAALAACGSTASYQKVRLEMPMAAPFSLEKLDEIIIASPWLPQEVKDVDLPKEFQDYFSAEFKSRFKGRVTLKVVSWDNEALLQNEGFWKDLAGGNPKVAVLAATAGFTQETRKAIMEKEKGSIEEPFVKEKIWDVRKSFTLQGRLCLFSGETGKALYNKEYKETATSDNPNQRPAFALYTLLQRLKAKVFRAAFGATRIQERYLLTR